MARLWSCGFDPSKLQAFAGSEAVVLVITSIRGVSGFVSVSRVCEDPVCGN